MSIKIRNDYDDRDVTVTARRIFDGADGNPTVLEPGEEASIDAGTENQVNLSVRLHDEAEEERSADIPAASKGDAVLDSGQGDDSISGSDGGAELTEAPDDVIRFEINSMVESKSDLTRSGGVNLEALNKRLADRGFAPVDGKRRDSLSPTPA